VGANYSAFIFLGQPHQFSTTGDVKVLHASSYSQSNFEVMMDICIF